jgi:hypothetical protein
MDIREHLFVVQQQMIGLLRSHEHALYADNTNDVDVSIESAHEYKPEKAAESIIDSNEDIRHFSMPETSNSSVSKVESLSFQAVIDAVRYPHLAASQAFLKRVNMSEPAASLYKVALAHMATLSSPALAAASSSGNIYKREANGFTISVSNDPDNTPQAFVLLKLTQFLDGNDDAQATSSENTHQNTMIHLHIGLHQQFYHLAFTNPHENSFQTIILKTSPEYLAIVEPDAHLYITGA